MEKLPTILPVFRVKSTILMPQAQLPIVMFENDYLAISSEVIENNIVAIIQPKPVLIKDSKNKESSKSFAAGCAGRITEIIPIANEITINIYGLCRFEVLETFPADVNGIERVSVNYEKFSIDTEKSVDELEIDRPRLMNALDLYFRNLEIAPNWKEIEKTPTSVLVSALAMACPFHPSEKQSLLETVDAKERSNMIIKIIEMNSFDRYHTANIVN